MMTYKDTLFFIGKCLTISHEEENLQIVTVQIKSDIVDWDAVVKVSTSHYVFPALYCNLFRANLLSYLPEELVVYMKHITDLNRERNLQIIDQAKEINEILRNNGILPIFLKGTGNLLEGLYEDVAERMLGDIDFLVPEKHFESAINIFKNIEYQKTSDKLFSPIIEKHYPRLYNKKKIAAVEIHIDMVKKNLSNIFNYTTCKDDFLTEGSLTFLGKSDQLILTILAKQYNDYGQYYKTISLRNSYDVFLLSQYLGTSSFKKKHRFLKKILNPYLALSSNVLHSKSINYIDDKKTRRFLKVAFLKMKFPLYYRLHKSFFKKIIYLRLKFLGLLRFINSKEFRNYYLKKISNS